MIQEPAAGDADAAEARRQNAHISGTQRPVSLTVVCLVGGIAVVLAAARILSRWDALLHLPTARAVAGVLAILVVGASLVGYWMMRRWGIWLVGMLVVARVVIALAGWIPLRSTDLVLPVAILLVGMAHLPRLR